MMVCNTRDCHSGVVSHVLENLGLDAVQENEGYVQQWGANEAFMFNLRQAQRGLVLGLDAEQIVRLQTVLRNAPDLQM